MIQDRGNIKWASMMLPEHLELLREYKQQGRTEQPRELTEWELEELQKKQLIKLLISNWT